MRSLSLVLLWLLAAVPSWARDWYVSPAGEGARDGTSWESALPGEAVSATVNERMQPGDKLWLAGGRYEGAEWNFRAAGTAEKPIEIAGMDRGAGLPLLVGTWSEAKPEQGRTAITLGPGARHLTLVDILVDSYMVGVAAGKAEVRREGVALLGLQVSRCRHGFYFQSCEALSLVECRARRYTKHGFRLEADCEQVTFAGCIADCSEGDATWETKTELFPFGFLVNDAARPSGGIRFQNCTARNNLMPLQKTPYKNGDGFVVEKSATEVSFAKCRAIRNQDGGFDLKTLGVMLEDCVALGNSRNFRVWHTGTLRNCLAAWGGVGLWNDGGPLEVRNSTFHALREVAVLSDDHATAAVTLHHSLVCAADEPAVTSGRGGVKFAACKVAGVDGVPADLGLPMTVGSWDRFGTALNSPYPAHGYVSSEE